MGQVPICLRSKPNQRKHRLRGPCSSQAGASDAFRGLSLPFKARMIPLTGLLGGLSKMIFLMSPAQGSLSLSFTPISISFHFMQRRGDQLEVRAPDSPGHQGLYRPACRPPHSCPELPGQRSVGPYRISLPFSPCQPLLPGQENNTVSFIFLIHSHPFPACPLHGDLLCRREREASC